MSTLQLWTVVANVQLLQGVYNPSILLRFLQNRLCLLHKQPVLLWIVVGTSRRICLWVSWSLLMLRFRFSTIDWRFVLFVVPSPYPCFCRWCMVRSNHKDVHSSLSEVASYTHIRIFYRRWHRATWVLSEAVGISSLTFLASQASWQQVGREQHQGPEHEIHSSWCFHLSQSQLQHHIFPSLRICLFS